MFSLVKKREMCTFLTDICTVYLLFQPRTLSILILGHKSVETFLAENENGSL